MLSLLHHGLIRSSLQGESSGALRIPTPKFASFSSLANFDHQCDTELKIVPLERPMTKPRYAHFQ